MRTVRSLPFRSVGGRRTAPTPALAAPSRPNVPGRTRPVVVRRRPEQKHQRRPQRREREEQKAGEQRGFAQDLRARAPGRRPIA